MAQSHFYPIGTPGKPWGDEERAQWFARAGVVKRSYAEDVVAKLEPLKSYFDVEQYGALSLDPDRYPLYVIKTRGWDAATKPCVLITGGTHGYETSGVQGALLFASTQMEKYSERFNIAICPCVSPWSYECIQRWNPAALDPNRFYLPNSPAEECAAVVDLVTAMAVPQWSMHLDLHETTDSDLTEFIPARFSRDGSPWADESIPDGFFLIGINGKEQPEWHKAMIDAVRKVTHIAPPDAGGDTLADLPIAQEGVVNSGCTGMGKGVTNASFASTTELYPDSKTNPVTGEQANCAQAACITGGLDYIIANVLDK